MVDFRALDRIGKVSDFEVGPKTRAGLRLLAGPVDVLLPNKWVTDEMKEGQRLSAFVYTDSEDRLVATTQRPRALVGEFACLSVIDQSPHGAFLDWGLDKDLFLPSGEQHAPVQMGDRVVVAVYLDNVTGRVAASARLAQFLDEDTSELEVGEQVQLLIYHQHARGHLALVNERWGGMLYFDHTFASLKVGDEKAGFISALREDGKLDLTLRPVRAPREQHRDAQALLERALADAGGKLPLGDKSPPNAIYEHLGISKKAFKAAAGSLMKQGRVRVGKASIESLDDKETK